MEYYNLTTPQSNIWSLQKYYEDTAIANLCGAVFYSDKRDTELLKKAVNQVVEKQTALRLHYVEKNGAVKQYVIKYSYVDIPLSKFDSEREFEGYAKKLASNPMGVYECDMYRFEIVCIGEKVGVLVVLSHLISDAWTFSLIVKETDKAYKNLSAGNEKYLEYADYIDYVQSEEKYFKSEKYERDKAYWQKKYAFKPEKTSIKVSSIPANSIVSRRFERKMGKELAERIEGYCLENSITPAVFFETALYCYLFRINPDNHKVTLGIPVVNRTKIYEKRTAGMFVSTIPLTIELSEEDTLKYLTEKITEAHIEIFRHQKYPYSMMLKYLRETHDFEGNLYDVMFSFQNAQADTASYTKWYSNGYSEVPFALHIDNRDYSDSYTFTIDYREGLFEEKEITDIVERMLYILGQIVYDDNALIKDIDIVPEKEKERILFGFNNTREDYPRDKCVHELFMEQVQKTPDAVAVIFEEKGISYRKLDEMSNVLAHLLIDKGVGRGDIVPIIAKRNWHILVAMLGVLKSGAGYMPVAPDYPKDRVQFIINEAGSRIGCVLGYEEKLEGIELLNLDELSLENAEEKQKLPVENRNEAGDICYVIFTSGSTGVPKGVMIKHSNVVNYSHNNNNNNVCHAVIKDGYRKIISVTNIVFDIFVTESILPLLNGMTVYLTSDDEVFRQSAINRIITKNGIEVLQTTPTKIKGYLSDSTQKEYLSTLKVIILGGEAMTTGLYEELRKQTEAQIFNIYGPAETTVWSSNAKVENHTVTIGRPIANTQIYILDRHGKPVPVGVPGELCIAGEGVGLGYLNRPDLTEERFVENPFATEENGHGKIMYHTGDLAAWRENGEIEYLGRIDTQVKIRGLRIELGEIESVMAEFPGIRMCAVTDKRDKEGRQYLAGYYTVDSMGDVKIEEKELRKYLLSKLPRYMVPNYFMCLPEMPMTPSGKTDRKNLPVPEEVFSDLEEYIEPVTDLEKTLCNIMEEVLDYRPIGLLHDFFSFGGDSLKAMEFMAIAEDRGVKLKLQDIFDYPTVRELIKNLHENSKRIPKLTEKEYNPERFLKYEPLLMKNKAAKSYEIHKMTVKSILLTGITGFLGAHIADTLLQDDECIVYCLVRSKGINDGIERVRQMLEYYFGNKYSDLIGTRIITIIGDITDEHISEKLPKKVDVVIHAAATVKHYGSYDYFYKVNTLGTQNIANYALQSGIRFVHISTISVSGNSLADNFDTEISLEEKFFAEDCLYQNQALKNVYVRSKFEAECTVLDAMLKGLQANIIRVGNLTNRSKDYQFQPNYMENAFLTRIKAALELGCLPDYMLPLYSEFSPVDDTADAIVRIVKHFNMRYTIFHVYSNQNLYFKRLLEILKELSISMKVVDGETFSNLLKRTVKENKSYLYEAFLGDMDGDGKLRYETNIHIQNNFTLSYLKQLGFEWTQIDYEYVKGYIEYYKRLGFLEVNINED